MHTVVGYGGRHCTRISAANLATHSVVIGAPCLITVNFAKAIADLNLEANPKRRSSLDWLKNSTAAESSVEGAHEHFENPESFHKETLLELLFKLELLF